MALKCQRQNRRRRGFTFVELLIAATMLAILFVGLSGHLQGGVAVWHRATKTVEALQRHRVAFDRLEQDLANAVNFTISIEQDEALSAQLSTQFQADHAQWWIVSPTTSQRQGGVQLVAYQCTQREGKQGLWRMIRTVSDARAGREPTATLLLPDCEKLSVSYAYLPTEPDAPLEWLSSWEQPGQFPRLLTISLHEASGGDLQRLMAIPSGVLPPLPVQ